MGGDTTTRPRRATWDVTTPDESIAMKLERLDAVSLRKVVERACRSSKSVQHAIDEALKSIDAPPAPPGDDARFKPLAKHRSTAKDGKPDCVVIVDPLSTGATLAAMAADRGFLIVRVLSQAFPDEIASCLPDGLTLHWHASLEYDAENPSRTVEALRSLDAHVLGVLVGCESGVECHDALTSALRGHPSNGPERSLARRDKHPMGECVRNAGLRAVRQELCGSWDSARVFCESLGVNDTETSAWCVLKPCKSAGTDGVYIAKTLEECQQRFSEILGTETVFGESNDNVLVQEFMKGTEYVVDHVSVEGVHKCVAIWCAAASVFWPSRRRHRIVMSRVDGVWAVLNATPPRHRRDAHSGRHRRGVDASRASPFTHAGGTTRDPATARSSSIIAWSCISPRTVSENRN